MRYMVPEDWFDTAERLPHNAAGRAFRAYAARTAPHRVRTHPAPGWTLRFPRRSWTMLPGTPQPRTRLASPLRPSRTLTKPMLPHEQDQVPPDHNAIEPPPGLAPPDERSYRDADGLITMCVACHRMQRPGTELWDRIPLWEANPPPDVTGGLCVACFQQHYARYLPQSDDAVA